MQNALIQLSLTLVLACTGVHACVTGINRSTSEQLKICVPVWVAQASSKSEKRLEPISTREKVAKIESAEKKNLPSWYWVVIGMGVIVIGFMIRFVIKFFKAK